MVKRTLLAGAALLAIGQVSAARAADLHIAVAGPITGSNATFGTQLKNGAEQAVADINAKGGVLGQKLVLDVADDACDPKQAVSAANQIAGKGIKFVDGHFCSSSSIPASKVYGEEGILQISPASTNPAFTDNSTTGLTFRVCGRDDQQGEVAGKYLAKRFKDAKVAIIHDNSAYGKGLADETKKNMNAAGKQEALYTAYVPGEKDYSALVSRMKEAGISVIYLGGYQAEAGLIVRQAKEQGMNVTLVGGDSLVTNEFWQITGDKGEGTLMTFPSDPRKRATAAAVVKEFKDKNIDPEGYVLYTYAAIQVWKDAATKAKSTDAKKVAAELKSGGPWSTVLGSVAFDKKGDVKVSDYVFYVWHNGTYTQMPNS